MPRPLARIRRIRRHLPAGARASLGALVGLGWLLPSALTAAEPARRPFDLPAGDAVTTLKRFAEQSDEQLLYSTDDVSGVSTHAVHGEFVPLAALEQMLRDTSLTPRPNGSAHAIAITVATPSRAPPPAPPPSPPAPAATSPSRPTQPPSVKTRSLLSLVAGVLAGTVPAGAQTVANPPKDETITLSPFTVSTDRDTGFVAASSLAGGRLATDLADTPVAYSVITRDFIDALGLTNAFDAADWSPNAVKSIAGNGGGYGDDVSNSPGSYNVRGAGGGRGLRNFFIYFSPNDSYVVERFDFGRGPNAVLFGNGSLGGVATTMTKQARFGSNFTEIAQTFGSWNNSRTTLDFNRALTDRVAVRTAAVYGDSDGWRDKQFEKIRAAFLTTSFKLTRNTMIRAEGEYGESKRNQTFTNLSDQLSGWDGKTVFDNRLSPAPGNANAAGVGRRGTGYNVYSPFSGSNTIQSYQNDWITLAGGATTTTPLGGYTQGSLPSFASAGANILYSYNLPGNRFDNAIAGSAFRLPAKSFSLASDAPVIQERFKDLELTADHRIGDLFIQAAVDVNRANQRINNIDVRNSNVMYIDISRQLPDGTANTHFLQPYADGVLRRNLNYRNSQAARFAVGYVKDAGNWGNKAENLSIAQKSDHRRCGATSTTLTETDRVRIRRYGNESSRGYYEPTSIRFVDPVLGIDKTVNPFWALENDRSDSQQYTKTRFKYVIAAINAKYFKNRLIVLGAVRGDDFYNYNRQQVLGGDYDPNTWDGKTVAWKKDGPADWGTLTYVPKDANGVATGPVVSADTRPRDGNGNRLAQYANDRFKDDFNAPPVKKSEITRSIGTVFHLTKWLSPYINYAETFNPPNQIQRIDSSFLPPTVAKGVDIGVRASLFGGRLNISALHYVNSEKNAPFGSTGVGDINNIAAANAVGDTSTGGRNIRSFANVPAVLTDLQDREAKGYELETVANLSKQWRLSFNVGLPKVYQTDAARDFIKFYDTTKGTLKQIVLDTGATIDANDNASVSGTGFSADASSAANSYNNLRIARQNAVSKRRITQDQPSVNFYTDYTLGFTKLKGLRLGGGVQYRGKQIIGYRASDTIVNPANPAAAIDDPNVDAYTPVYSPASYYTVVATVGYTLRLEKKREVRFDLRVNNLLNAQGPIFAGSTALRPKGGDLTSPARETVPNVYAYKQPVSLNLTTTVKF
ncbi:MAG: hypothetical protein NTV51_20585 [Verrucomicrobia bacterium]|nr:hypothetical protein [Verrucomicrobiota bacterium]